MILLFAVVYALIISLSNSLFCLVIESLLPVIILINCPGNLKSLVKLNALNLFMIMTLALTWPNFREGVIMGLIITWRLNLIYIIFAGVIAKLGFTGIYAALVRFHVPEKLRILLLLTMRGIFIMNNRLDSALIALKLRAPEMKFMTRLKTFGYITGNILLQSESRSEKMLQAIKCRGGFEGFNQL